MKQHVATKQLLELNEDQLKVLNKWCVERNYCEPKNEVGVLYEMRLSIGQMIEFLEDSGKAWWSIRKEEINVFVGEMPDDYEGHYAVYMDEKTTGNTLVDALWSAVKEVLETKTPNLSVEPLCE